GAGSADRPLSAPMVAWPPPPRDRWPHGGERGGPEAGASGAPSQGRPGRGRSRTWDGGGWTAARWGRRWGAWDEGGWGGDWKWPSVQAGWARGRGPAAAARARQGDGAPGGAEWCTTDEDGAASADEDELPGWIAHHDLVLSPRSAEGPPPRFTLLFLHSGSNGPADVFYYVPHLFGQVRPQDVRVVAPCSPRRRLSWGGQFCNCWYEYTTDRLRLGGEQDAVSWAHFIEQRRRLLRLLEDEHRRLPPGGRIVLGGLSQGAALALDLVLHAPEHVDSIAGCFCTRGMMQSETLWDLTEESVARRAGSCPVLVFHGRSDAIVPWRAAQRSYEWLVSQGFDVKFHTRKWVSHSSECQEEYQEVARFAARAWRNVET
ncbi:unnamed protein product, partial [Prorocentrum cordatum]